MSRKSTARVPSPKANNNCIGNEEGWDNETTKELLHKMKQVIPKPDITKYKTQLEKFEWSKIQVAKFTSEECQTQWSRICKKLRKFKTLSDLVADSLEYVENPYKGNVKKHPDHPKRPLTPYFRFFLSEREKYAASHKDMSNLQITNVLSKKYREISMVEKDKYMDEWKLEMVEYRAKLEQFKKDHPEYYDKTPPRLSRTPLQIFNGELSPTLTSENPSYTKRELDDILRKKYHDLDDDQKLPYILKAIEEQEKYKEELEMYKKSHPSFVPTASQTKSTLTLADWRIHDKSLGMPDRPPANGYNLFCTRTMLSEEMKHLSSRERIMQCGQKWKLLTTDEKNAYQIEFLTMREHYRVSMKGFLKSLLPRQREEYLERKNEYESKKGSKRKLVTQVKEEVIDSHVSSEEAADSESGSSSSESSSDEEEEEEDDDGEDNVENRSQLSNRKEKFNSSAPLRPTTPISALFLYQKAHREKYSAKYPKASKSEITLMLARKFNNLPQERKAKYLQKEKEQRALHNEKMRKHMLAEQEQAENATNMELKPITGEQIFQERSKESYLKKNAGDHDKAQAAMRKAWTQMNKEKRSKYVSIAHERNTIKIEEHKAAKEAAEENKKKKPPQKSPPPSQEMHLSQKELKSYLSLEPRPVAKDAQTLFNNEMRPRFMHLTSTARNQELARLWSELATSTKSKYRQRVQSGLQEYDKRLQRWIKSLPPKAYEAYQVAQKKLKQTKNTSTAMKRKTETNKTNNSKKAKLQEDSESSDDSSDDNDSSSDSDDSSSDDDDDEEKDSASSAGSDRLEDGNKKGKPSGTNINSSDSSSSSSSDEDSDSSD